MTFQMTLLSLSYWNQIWAPMIWTLKDSDNKVLDVLGCDKSGATQGLNLKCAHMVAEDILGVYDDEDLMAHMELQLNNEPPCVMAKLGLNDNNINIPLPKIEDFEDFMKALSLVDAMLTHCWGGGMCMSVVVPRRGVAGLFERNRRLGATGKALPQEHKRVFHLQIFYTLSGLPSPNCEIDSDNENEGPIEFSSGEQGELQGIYDELVCTPKVQCVYAKASAVAHTQGISVNKVISSTIGKEEMKRQLDTGDQVKSDLAGLLQTKLSKVLKFDLPGFPQGPDPAALLIKKGWNVTMRQLAFSSRLENDGNNEQYEAPVKDDPALEIEWVNNEWHGIGDEETAGNMKFDEM
ncbi:hypothetical protein DFH28DRAFT_921353 [Melampsora americana]|nr:hypothetical protein DFH28DRAFT_921353 [Melampsora americana]